MWFLSFKDVLKERDHDRSVQFDCDTRRRMNGHVRKMHFQQILEKAATLLYFLLILAVDSTKAEAASRNQQCWKDMQQTLLITRLVHKETMRLLKLYKTSQGEGFHGDFCRAPVVGIPDPTISGLEPSERIASMYTQVDAFLPHLKRVHEQQTDLQPLESPLLKSITIVEDNSRRLARCIEKFYRNFFPNLPLPEGGPTTLPPPLNVFQQKVYGCVVLTTYKKLLANILKERRTVKNKVCGLKTNAVVS